MPLPYYVPGVPYGASPVYGGLFDTGGPGDADDEMLAEQIAEQVAAEAAGEHVMGDTGAVMPQSLLQRAQTTVASLFRRIGVPPPPALASKVVQKAAPKLAGKLAAAAPVTRPAPILRAPALVQPVLGAVAGRVRKPITSMAELMQRVEWAQLATLTTNPTTLGIGATNQAATLTVTRSGYVLDWGTNNNNGNVLASNLTYGQLPNTIFGATPLSQWGPAAANPSPIEPLEVNMPATFNVLLTNTNAAAAEVITWNMSGIPTGRMTLALMDPDVRDFLASRGLEIAKAAQGGYGSF